MHLAQLQQVVEAVAKLLNPERIVVIGSSAFLANFPEIAALPEIETSKDADLFIHPCSEVDAQIVFEALGEGRAYSKKFGVHADLLRPEICELLPKEWETRLVPFGDSKSIFSLDAHDAAVAKLRVGREKDLSLLSKILAAGMLDWSLLQNRLRATSMPEKEVIPTNERLLSLKTPKTKSPPPADEENLNQA